MSQEVDSRVVEMRFDNANFEKNTKQTISTIDRLMEKLQFKGAEKGFEKLDAAAENVDFATMQTSLDRLESKFSSLNIVATTALVNITNKFVDAGEKLVKSLSIDQVASGWDKYTEKTSNVQTIMNATGKSIDQVNGYLNKLMWYSDETSYSFSEMTSALSQMTAAGGNIDKMIPMIMGIANATADAGKTGFAFQSTIRNLTQSYSAGHLQLQDWKSLNLMGTATKALKQELIDTAVELGTLKKGEVTIGTFESSLSKKWANTKVMEKTFEKYASMMEAAYEMTQKNKGMTSSEALEKLSGQYGELAERAALAAQQATSFGQAIDSTKDAVSSKWMAVFETFFGNKEEATETWTELSDRLYDIFVPSIDGLNERLKDGLNSGWAQLQGRLGDQADAYSYTLQQVALASGAVTEDQITEAGSFTKALQQNGVSAQLLKASLDEAQTSAEKLLTLSDKEMAAKGYDRETIQRDAEAFAKLNAEIQNGTLDLDEYAKKIGELSGREHLVQSFWNIMDAIGKVVAPVKEAFSEIFPPADGERIYSFAERLDLMTQKLIITDQTAEKIKKTFKGLFTVLKGVTTILSKIGAVAKEAFSLLANAAKPVAQVMLSVGAGLGDFLETIYKVATGSGTLREKLGGIRTALTKLLSPVDALGSMLKSTKIAQYIDTFLKKGEESTGLLGTLYSVGRRAFDGLSAVIRTAASGGIGILGALGMAISTLLSKLGGLGEKAVQVLGLTKPNLEDFQQNLIDMPKNLSKSMSEFASSFQRSMNKINGSVGDAFAPVKQFFTAVKEGFDAISGTDVYRFMSLIDVGLLAFSIGQMAKATKSLKAMLETPLTGMLNSISGTFKQLTSAIKTWQKNESTKTLTGMATAILILAGAMYVMSRINPDQFTEIASTVFGFVTLLTVSAKLLEPTTKRFTKAFDSLKASALNAATLWGTAAALIGLGIAIGSITKGLSRIMEVMQKGHIAANVSALVVATASIVAMMLAMRQLSGAGGWREGHEPQGDPFDGGRTGGAERCHQGAFHRSEAPERDQVHQPGKSRYGGGFAGRAADHHGHGSGCGKQGDRPDRISKWSRDRSHGWRHLDRSAGGEQSGEHSACPAGCGHDQHQDPDAPDDHHVGLFVQDEVRLRRGHPCDVYLPCCTGRSRGAVCRDGGCGHRRAGQGCGWTDRSDDRIQHVHRWREFRRGHPADGKCAVCFGCGGREICGVGLGRFSQGWNCCSFRSRRVDNCTDRLHQIRRCFRTGWSGLRYAQDERGAADPGPCH
jgi:hypothetical protein